MWLKLVENLAALRETRALPGWIKTTAGREALRILNTRRRTEPMDPSVLMTFDPQTPQEGADSDLLRWERDRAVQNSLAELAPEHRRLLVLLHAEPSASYREITSYREISTTLGIPPGSIGPTRPDPTRARCAQASQDRGHAGTH